MTKSVELSAYSATLRWFRSSRTNEALFGPSIFHHPPQEQPRMSTSASPANSEPDDSQTGMSVPSQSDRPTGDHLARSATCPVTASRNGTLRKWPEEAPRLSGGKCRCAL